MGGRGKEKKMSENEKRFEIDTVSQLFLHGMVACTLGLTNDLIDDGQLRAKNSFKM